MRRRFLAQAAAAAGAAFSASTLSILAAHAARGAKPHADAAAYGALSPTPDADGHVALALPPGFRYVTFSRTGEAYAPGGTVPRNHDGMACFGAGNGTVRLIRNHELRNAPGDMRLGIHMQDAEAYDPLAMGGCVAIDFDVRTKRAVRELPVLGGTMVNCSGGCAWRDAGWITCEETTAGVKEGFSRPHGYAFMVPASAQSAIAAVPLKALGRFAHEAAVADAQGIVYLTEDAGMTSGFYRFTPERPADLTRGRLQMLALRDEPRADLHGGRGGASGPLPAVWVDIDEPDAELERGAPTCFQQGRARGAAAFHRLEGIHRGEDGVSIYFVATSGGTRRDPGGSGYGQIWRYVPAGASGGGELACVFDSPAGSVLESPDNLCVTPRGALLLCEDDAIGDGDTHVMTPQLREVNRLIGLTRDGSTFVFAVNLLNASEFAGACFSPDGEILFVNLFGDSRPGSGMTCAIWGPWARGPL